MEPFTIFCSTCQSRIRVRNPKMIGQLANCPKCHSMIMIEVPNKLQVDPEHGPPVDSTAMTKEGLEQPASAASSLESSTEAAAESKVLQAFDSSEDLGEASSDDYRLAKLPDDSPPQGPPQSSLTDDDHADAWRPTDRPLLPTEEWTSESTTRTRQILLVGSLAVAGLAFAIIGFFLFLSWYDSPSGEATADLPGDARESEQPIAPKSGEDARDEQQGAAPGQPVDDANADLSPVDESASVDQGDAADQEAGDGPDAAEEPVAELPAVELNVGDESNSGDPLEAPSQLSTADASSDVADSPGRTRSAADAKADGDQPVVSEDSPSINRPVLPDVPIADGPRRPLPEAQDSESAGPDLPSQLEFFGPMLAFELQPVLPDVEVEPSEPPVTAEELGLDRQQAAESLPPVDWQQQSQVTINGLIIKDMPMSQMLNLWTHLSGVPTTVDFQSLAAANADRDRMVSLQVTESQSIDELTRQLEQATDLRFSPKENRFLSVHASETQIATQLPDTLILPDELSDEENSAWLQETLVTLFPRLENSLDISGGELTVDRDQVDWRTWYAVVQVLATLRDVSGHPPGADDYRPENVLSEFITAEEVQALQATSDHVLLEAKPVGQLLNGVARRANLHCWIDWPSLGARGVGPETTVAIVTHSRTAQQILADCEAQLGLVVTILDRRSVWITTPDAHRSQAQVFVLPRGKRSLDQWRQALRRLSPIDDEGVGQLVVIPTPDQQAIIVRASRPTLSF